VSKPVKAGYSRPLDLKHGRVDLTHGSGGRAMAQLIDQLFAAAFDNPVLAQKNDMATFRLPPGRVVMATDAHVVSPLFFPGGDIGCLSVHGTVNDVAMSGAQPIYLAASFILEEGFPLADLKRIVESMAAAAREAGVAIVTGDTKVVEQGKGDGVFITTTGVGVVDDGLEISGERAQPGDRIIVSGPVGDHGMAIMSLRESLAFDTEIVSDTAALHRLVDASACCAIPRVAGWPRRSMRSLSSRAWACCSTRRRSRYGRRWLPPASSSGSIRCTWPTRASWWPSSRPTPAMQCWRRCARIRRVAMQR
jgi:hydrogenase expression/formation protein HypE